MKIKPIMPSRKLCPHRRHKRTLGTILETLPNQNEPRMPTITHPIIKTRQKIRRNKGILTNNRTAWNTPPFFFVSNESQIIGMNIVML